jgi:N-methylhydantoinase B
MRVIVGNSRAPGRIRSDIEALAAAAHVASRRTADVVAKHGLATINEAIEVMLDTTERMTRASIEKIPDGVYVGSYRTEDDGVDIGKTYEIHVKITVAGSEVEVDFTGSSAQARGAINSSLSQSVSFVAHALRCYMENDIRENEGFYRPIKVVLPQGSLMNPDYPAATNIRFATGQSMVDAISEAFRPIFPDRTWAPGASAATINAFGRTRAGDLWSAFDVIFGPSGARANGDAIEGFPWPMMGQAGYMRNVEIYEMLFPALFHYYQLEEDSSGAGRWRGASSIAKQVEFLEAGELTTRGNDRFKLPPLGVEGGLPGMVGRLVLNEGTDRERALPPKCMNIPIKAGDVLSVYTPGGGGYGPPEKREPERVLQDVRRGYVSRKAAHDIYKVEITTDGALDEARTAELRKEIAR